MAVHVKKPGAKLVVLRFGGDEVTMWLPEMRAPGQRPRTTRRPWPPTRAPTQQPTEAPVRTNPKKPVPGSPPLPPFALVIHRKTSLPTAPHSPLDGVILQAVRVATVKAKFSMPYRDLVSLRARDVAGAIETLRRTLAQPHSLKRSVLNVQVGRTDRTEGIDITRLRALVDDPSLGLSAVRLVFVEPQGD